MTLMDHVARYVALKRRLGYDYRTHAAILRRYARFADGRGDSVVRTTTVTEWASVAVSRHQAARRLHFVHAFAVWNARRGCSPVVCHFLPLEPHGI